MYIASSIEEASLYTFSAIIYDGNKQHLVKQDVLDQVAFEAYLQQQYGCYVCLWCNQEPTQSVLDVIASTSNSKAAIPEQPAS